MLNILKASAGLLLRAHAACARVKCFVHGPKKPLLKKTALWGH